MIKDYKINSNDPWYRKLWIKLKFRLFGKPGEFLLTGCYELSEEEAKRMEEMWKEHKYIVVESKKGDKVKELKSVSQFLKELSE